ncbi:sensor histidine kinase [Microbacterium sediminicola]
MIAVILGGAVIAALAIFPVLAERDRSQLETVVSRVTTSLEATGGASIQPGSLPDIAGSSLGVILLDDAEVLAAAGLPVEDVEVILATASETMTDVEGRYLTQMVDTSSLDLTFDTGTDRVAVTDAVLVVRTADREAIGILVITALSVTALVTTTILIIAAMIVVGRGLRPLTTIAARAERIADGDRTLRLPVDDTGDPEIARMARTINVAFDVQEDAENRVRAFVADASHELRTPLTSATGWIELYQRGGLTDPARLEEALGRVSTQLERMRTMTDELALLARTDAGRPLESARVDLSRIALDTVADARVLHPQRQITVHVNGEAWVLGDEPRLAQVVRNLVGNALQHTPDEATITVTVTSVAGRRVLRVSDTGHGIPATHLPHLFERFWRADPARSGAGSGLGLSIVQALVQAHGGSIGVTSVPGEGTTFEVSLPALATPDA